MYRELAQEVRLNTVVANLSKKLLSSRDVDDISLLVLEQAKELTNSKNGIITYIDPKTGVLVCPPLALKDSCFIPEPEKLLLQVQILKETNPVISNNCEEILDVFPKYHCNIQRFLSVPAFVNGEQVGNITLANADREYTLRDLEAIGQLADLYAIAIQRKQSEIALEESEQYYNLILNSLPDIFILCEVVENSLKVLKVNCRALNVLELGRSEEDIIGKMLEGTMSREIAASWLDNGKKSIIDGKVKIYEVTNNYGIYEVHSIPITNTERKCTHLIYTGRDISERKKNEEHLQKMEKLESVGLLAGGIAHDFNNILTAIIGNASLAKLKINKEDDKKVFQLLTEIEKASLGAKDLTQQLLTFAEGGTPVLATVSIGELLRESSAFALRGSNVRCEFQIPDDLWPVEIDRGQINQVIYNLVINADQAMFGGGIINISAKNIIITKDNSLPLTEGKYIIISIKDHGEGIAPENMDKLFDPYFSTKKMGSGLGLTTSYSIIRKHNGFITVESKPGLGTTFHIYLPASQNLSRPDTVEKTANKCNGKILVMDDEKMLRFVLSEMLNYLGYEVACAKDGNEAINMYRDAAESGNPFDGIIMDLTIPGGMGGKEAIRHLMEIDPNVKAIVSSGYSNDPVMSNHLEYGFSAVVSKPYTIEQIADTLQNLIGIDELTVTSEDN